MDTATRRTFLKRSAGIGLAAIGGSYLRIGHTADDHIYVTSSGGSFLENGRKHMAEPFEKQSGVKVTLVPGTNPAHALKILSSRGTPPYDVAAFGGNDMYRLIRAKKLAQVDEKSVPSLADVPEKFKADWEGCGSLYDYSSVGIAYRPDKIQGGVKSWKEFVERTVAGEFGKQVFFNNLSSNVRGAEVLSMFGKIYGSGYGDIEASIATLERMKPHIFKFFTAFNDPVVLLTSGEGAIGPGWDGRTFIAEDSTKGMVKWVDPTEGAVSSGPVMAVVKGGKEDLAKAFMNYALGEEAQKAFCEAMYYGAVNRKVQYSEKLKHRLPSIDSVQLVDTELLIKNMSALLDLWNKRIAS
ncbi:ABC transporter substrate-binding protein [Bordetella parapertussis]|uniref:Extracellular solute-binding protein n=1 Tax=Bordetella parapertussis (strain Bpp5) TaxID=1208660 RepID=K0MMT4_BORPB|nr:ABC transporter substrate-binding protein [Bordetella parapertussis]CCJ51122.1 putative extracellular solute-binding protein [Bordetella parapertussis Bpp5]